MTEEQRHARIERARQLELVIALLQHAVTHSERENDGAVQEAIADAMRRLAAIAEVSK